MPVPRAPHDPTFVDGQWTEYPQSYSASKPPGRRHCATHSRKTILSHLNPLFGFLLSLRVPQPYLHLYRQSLPFLYTCSAPAATKLATSSEAWVLPQPTFMIIGPRYHGRLRFSSTASSTQVTPSASAAVTTISSPGTQICTGPPQAARRLQFAQIRMHRRWPIPCQPHMATETSQASPFRLCTSTSQRTIPTAAPAPALPCLKFLHTARVH